MTGSIRLPLSSYPGMNPFVLDWMAGEERATRLLRRDASLARPGARRSIDPALASALVESNRAWGIDATVPVSRWRSGEALTIVAGQQVGFAGGPLYTLAKIATVVRMRRDLEAKGIPATAFFWLATEDHDFEEVATLKVQAGSIAKEKACDRQRDLITLRGRSGSDLRAAVGPLPVPDSLSDSLVALLDMPRPGWLREGITFRDSFAELVASLFGDEVVLVDALLPELRRAGAPLFDDLRARRDDVQSALRARAAALESAGYREQVVPRDGDEYTLLFRLDDEGRRIPLAPHDVVPPEKVSTSAITRPLLQDLVLQPDIFVGGPAEIAYYAQLATLHEMFGIAMPRVALRGHVLVAPRSVLRTMERYAIDPARVFTSPEVLLAEKEPEAVAEIRATAEAARVDLMTQIGKIAEIAIPADRSLERSFERSIRHLDYHFDKLRERAVRGLVRKERERWLATCELVSTLFPDGKVQDRVAAWLPWWCRFGNELVERMVEVVEPDANVFVVAGV